MSGEKKIYERTFWKRTDPDMIGVATKYLGDKKTVQIYGENIGYTKEDISDEDIEKHMRNFEEMRRIYELDRGRDTDFLEERLTDETINCLKDADSEREVEACFLKR